MFSLDKLSILGLEIDETAISPLPENYPQPEPFRQLRWFIELIYYYQRVLPQCSTLLAQLTDFYRRTKKNANLLLLSPDFGRISQSQESLGKFIHTELCL